MENTEPMKSVEEIAINIAGVCTDEFLSILSEWFHPDEKWDRIEKTAREFLVEAIIRETKKALHSYTASREREVREEMVTAVNTLLQTGGRLDGIALGEDGHIYAGFDGKSVQFPFTQEDITN